MNIFESMFAVFDSTVTAYVSTATVQAAAYLTGPLTTLGTLSFIGFGFFILSGRTELPLREFINKSTAFALVLVVGGSAANYNDILASHLLAWPDELMGVFASVNATGGAIDDTASAGAVLDGIASRAIAGIMAMWQAGGIGSPSYYFAAVLFTFFFVVFAVLAAVTVAVMKFGLGLAVALGPLLMVGLLFGATRDFFTRWLSYCLQFAALGALIGGVAGLADVMMAQYLDPLENPGEALDMVSLIPTAIAMLTLGVIFGQLPSMASSITGGIALSAGRGVEQAFANLMHSGVRKTAQLAGRGVGAAGRGLAHAMGHRGGSVSEGGGGGGTISEGGRDYSPPAPRPRKPEADRPRLQPPKAPRVSTTREEEKRRVRERDREEARLAREKETTD